MVAPVVRLALVFAAVTALDEAGGPHQPKGFVFEQQARLTGDEGGSTEPRAERGSAVAVDGSTAAVGAPGDDFGGDDSGIVLVYDQLGDGWTLAQRLNPSDSTPYQRFGSAVAVSGDTMVVGAPSDRSARGAAYVFRRDPDGWTQTAKLVADDGSEDDRFGSTVAIDGGTLIVGAPRHSGVAPAGGTAYVFVRDGDVWIQHARLAPADLAAGDLFGSAVALLQDSVLVGAPYADGEVQGTGAVYEFVPDGPSWVETAKLSPPAATPDRRFGFAVASDQGLTLVGAMGGIDDAGAAHLFARVGAGWVHSTRMSASDAERGAEFGCSVSVDADTVVVGARESDRETGAAYIFGRDGGEWSEQARLVAADARAGTRLGLAVSVSGSVVLVGAPGDGGDGGESGAAFTFVRVGAVWEERQKLSGRGSGARDRTGFAVALDGHSAAVGAHGDDHSGLEDAGAVYVFERTAGVWAAPTKLTPADPTAGAAFGVSVALEGDVLLVGAYADNAAGGESGSAYVFTRTSSGWVQRAKLVASDASHLAFFGFSVALEDDTLVVGAEGGSSAYVFRRQGSEWLEEAKLTALPRPSGNPWTSSVAVSGDTVIVGTLSAPFGGQAAVFERNAGSWSLQQVLQAPDARASTAFGVPVVLSGDTAIVGDPTSGSGGHGAGAAYVFLRHGGEWSVRDRLSLPNLAEDARFGERLALAGGVLIVGAPGPGGMTTQAGSTYVFTDSAVGWVPQGAMGAADAAGGDRFGSAVALSGDTALVGAAEEGDGQGTDDVGAAYVFVGTEVPGELPRAAFTWAPDPALPGEPIQFEDASAGGPEDWSWSFGDGSRSAEPDPVHTYAAAGRYQVSLEVANALGRDRATRQITVSTLPSASFAWSPARPEPGRAVRFADTSTGPPESWSWDFGDGTSAGEQSPQHVFVSAGHYVVTLVAGNGRGSDEASLEIVVGDLAPVAEAVIAAVARVRGSGAFFTSRVDLFNPGQEPLLLELEYAPRSDLGGPTWMTALELPAGVLLEITDPLPRWFGFSDTDDAVGSLFLRRHESAHGAFLAQSVVFARNPDGTEYGQAFAAVPVADALPAGEVAYLATTVDATRFRVNAGVVALQDRTDVALTPVDPIGNALAAPAVLKLDRGGNRQLNAIHRLFDLGSRADFLVEVRPTAGSVVAYASVLDGLTGADGTSDPTTILPVRSGSDRVTLLELGSIQGLDEFSGSASVTNHSPEPASVNAELYLRGEPGVAATSSLTVEPGDTLGFPDMVDDLFDITGSVGTVVLSAPSPAVISAVGREFAVYRDDDGVVVGTAGQLVPGMTDDDLLQPGSAYHLLGLRQVEGDLGLERSHLAAFNPGAADVVLELTLVDGATGVEEGRIQRTVRAGELVRINSVIDAVNPEQDGGVKRLALTCDGPLLVSAYRVNGNGDPVTIDVLAAGP